MSTDWMYFLRSGLGIPDYWHPRLELQNHFVSGEVSCYPVSMEAKAHYPGRLSAEGIPIRFVHEKATISVVMVALYGLGSHDAFITTRDERYYSQMMDALRWLEKSHVTLGEGIGWQRKEDIPAFGLKTPWFSAIDQGFVLSLFVRAHQLEGTGKWSRLAFKTWLGFRVPVEEGGFCRKVPEGAIYEEYPGPRFDCVFNGMCHALIGLWEAWQSGLANEAKVDFDRGLRALRSYLPRFDHRGWSLYSLNQCLGKPFLASPYYHRANALLAMVVGHMGGESGFVTYGERWLKSSRSVLRRIRMSLQIGLDRYRGAPSLLLDRPKCSG